MHYRLLFLFLFIIVACYPIAQSSPISDELTSIPTQAATIVVTPSPAPTVTPESLEIITVPISVYILDDENDELSSSRTSDELEEIYERVNAIWAQAGIELKVQTIERVTAPPIYLDAIAARDFQTFFDGAGEEVTIPDPSLLNAFYARDIGGPNGITPFGTRAFFVTDLPSVHDERVTSHEIGHILGLHHTLENVDRLMYPGTNGMLLTGEEIRVVRYVARGLLAGVR